MRNLIICILFFFIVIRSLPGGRSRCFNFHLYPWSLEWLPGSVREKSQIFRKFLYFGQFSEKIWAQTQFSFLKITDLPSATFSFFLWSWNVWCSWPPSCVAIISINLCPWWRHIKVAPPWNNGSAQFYPFFSWFFLAYFSKEAEIILKSLLRVRCIKVARLETEAHRKDSPRDFSL